MTCRRGAFDCAVINRDRGAVDSDEAFAESVRSNLEAARSVEREALGFLMIGVGVFAGTGNPARRRLEAFARVSLIFVAEGVVVNFFAFARGESFEFELARRNGECQTVRLWDNGFVRYRERFVRSVVSDLAADIGGNGELDGSCAVQGSQRDFGGFEFVSQRARARIALLAVFSETNVAARRRFVEISDADARVSVFAR